MSTADPIGRDSAPLLADVEAIVPLRPTPINLREWPDTTRRSAWAAIAVLTVAAVLLIRPVTWNGLGGAQAMPGVATIPKIYLAFVPVAMATCAWLLAASMIRATHWGSYLGLAGLTVLGVEVGARVHIEASALVGHAAISASALHAAQSLGASGVIAELLAVSAGVLAMRRKGRATRGHRIAPWLMAGAFIVPLYAYLSALNLAPDIARQLTAPDPSLGVVGTASGNMADAIFQPYLGLIYMSAALAAWQAITFVQAITAGTPHAGRLLRLLENRGQNLILVVMLALLAFGKAAFDIAGYAHELPSWLGADAALWTTGDSSLVWWYTALVVAPISIWLIRRLTRADYEKPTAMPLLMLCTLFALFGPVQLVTQALSDFDPALRIRPPAGTPLFVSLNLLDNISLVLTGLAVAMFWRRNRFAAALFAISFMIHAPGVIGGDVGDRLPIAGLGRWDLLVSVVMAIACVFGVVRRRLPPAPLTALWLGLTVLVHFGTFVPDHVQKTWFVAGALSPVAWTLLWAGRDLNIAARRDAAGATRD